MGATLALAGASLSALLRPDRLFADDLTFLPVAGSAFFGPLTFTFPFPSCAQQPG